MAKGCFDRCHEVTAKWEGGWSDHPSDPGGKTMYGITLAKYREHYPKGTAADLRAMTRGIAEGIYFDDFWKPINGETLAAGVDLAVYDASVNSGVGRGKKWLMSSLGGTPAETVKAICAKRLGFMQSLKIWKTFGKGWSRRVADIEAKGVAWALAATGASRTATKVALETEANAATAKVVRNDVAMTGTSVAGVGSSVLSGQENQAANMTLLVILAGIAIAVTLVLILRSRVHNARKAAYLAEADKL